MSNYTSETASDLDPAYKSYFESFYTLSDTHPSNGGTAEKYAEQFTSDATFNLAGKVANGTQEIIKAREAMWDKVSSRTHDPRKIFVLAKGGDEVMIYGTVVFTTKDGQSNTKDWAARANLVQEGSEVKMKYYQIYM